MLTVSRGLDILDAEANPLLTELAFTKLNGRFGANHLIGREVAVRLSGTGQLSGDRLPASEQFTLGGDSIGRAFPSGYVVGDKGYGLSAELAWAGAKPRSEEHTSELQSLMRTSYAVFCLKKKIRHTILH